MKLQFEFEVVAECQQFLLHDFSTDTVENFPNWTREAGRRLLAVGPGIIAVGTISDGIKHLVLEIADCQPAEDMSGWDRVNEATIEVPSGCLIVAGLFDDLPDARRIDLEPGSYRARLHYGNLGSLSDDALSKEHYKVIMWSVAPGPLQVLKRSKKERINRHQSPVAEFAATEKLTRFPERW